MSVQIAENHKKVLKLNTLNMSNVIPFMVYFTFVEMADVYNYFEILPNDLNRFSSFGILDVNGISSR